MIPREPLSQGESEWNSWAGGFEWEQARENVEQEGRERILLLGAKGVGKSTLFNRLHGWNVSPVGAEDQRPGAAGFEDYGLFCLLDLPEEPTAGSYDNVEELSPWPAQLVEGANVLVYVMDGASAGNPCDYQWISRLRHMGRPLLVVSNKRDLLDGDDRSRVQEIEGRLSSTVLVVSALMDKNVGEVLFSRLVDICPTLAVALGREVRAFRRRAANRIIRRAALFNGLVALEPVPLLDVPLQTVTLIGLLLRIAAIYERPATDSQGREVVSAVGGSLICRLAAQQVVKLIPVLGWVLSGLIAASVTWLMGQAAIACSESAAGLAGSVRWGRTLRSQWQCISERLEQLLRTNPTVWRRGKAWRCLWPRDRGARNGNGEGSLP